jgi:hypothetical protein
MSELTEARIRAAKAKEKPYKLKDGRGLYLCWSIHLEHVYGVSGFASLDARAWSASARTPTCY